MDGFKMSAEGEKRERTTPSQAHKQQRRRSAAPFESRSLLTAVHACAVCCGLSNSMVMRNAETGEIVWQSDKW